MSATVWEKGYKSHGTRQQWSYDYLPVSLTIGDHARRNDRAPPRPIDGKSLRGLWPGFVTQRQRDVHPKPRQKTQNNHPIWKLLSVSQISDASWSRMHPAWKDESTINLNILGSFQTLANCNHHNTAFISPGVLSSRTSPGCLSKSISVLLLVEYDSGERGKSCRAVWDSVISFPACSSHVDHSQPISLMHVAHSHSLRFPFRLNIKSITFNMIGSFYFAEICLEPSPSHILDAKLHHEHTNSYGFIILSAETFVWRIWGKNLSIRNLNMQNLDHWQCIFLSGWFEMKGNVLRSWLSVHSWFELMGDSEICPGSARLCLELDGDISQLRNDLDGQKAMLKMCLMV